MQAQDLNDARATGVPTRRRSAGRIGTAHIGMTLFGAALLVVVTAVGSQGRWHTRTRLTLTGQALPVLPTPPGLVPTTNVDSRVLELALTATTCAVRKGVVGPRPATLTIIDFSRPSTQPRLWVLDLTTGLWLFEELVAHGSGSGGNLPTRFSNGSNSRQSSLGLFTTGEAYVGKHGYSLRLDGLEAGINDRARERAIVIHGAAYVSVATARALGRLGRSWGCPALRLEAARPVIDSIKGGGVVFAYYPNRTWLAGSSFLTHCDVSS